MSNEVRTGKLSASFSAKRPAVGGSLLSLLLVLSGCGGGAAPASSAAAPSSAAPKPAASSASSKPAASSSASKPAGASSSAAAKSSGVIPQIAAGTTVSITTATGVPSAVFTPVWIAVDKGYFAKHGLKVKLAQVEGVTQAQAIIAGDVQVGNVGGSEVLNSRVGGAQMVAIAEGTASPVFEIHAPSSV
ncbi:MAG: ABC transporter substrate-binding protein, partial [Chloroflexota bacterium]|nr:ABC transporter substrate-binding protein [Chloroflexota bacterium]